MSVSERLRKKRLRKLYVSFFCALSWRLIYYITLFGDCQVNVFWILFHFCELSFKTKCNTNSFSFLSAIFTFVRQLYYYITLFLFCQPLLWYKNRGYFYSFLCIFDIYCVIYSKLKTLLFQISRHSCQKRTKRVLAFFKKLWYNFYIVF